MTTDKSPNRYDRVRNSLCYKASKGAAHYFDDLLKIGPVRIGLDPLLGLFVPSLGDTLTQLTTLPALYCAIFEFRSIPLALACIYNSLKDWLVGLVPILGDVLDCAVRSNNANFRLLAGYVDDDPAIRCEVDSKAKTTAVLIVVLALAIWGVISLLTWAGGYIADAASGAFGSGE